MKTVAAPIEGIQEETLTAVAETTIGTITDETDTMTTGEMIDTESSETDEMMTSGEMIVTGAVTGVDLTVEIQTVEI